MSSHHQRDFLWQQIGADVETLNQKERVSKLEISTGSLPLELREFSGGRKTVRVRAGEGHQKKMTH